MIVSHHYSGPDATFPRGDARLDFTDLYVFPKPGDAGRSIFVMNFHPSAHLDSGKATSVEPFAPEARYELRIDTNGDVVADLTYQLRFSPSDGEGQTATLRTFEGAEPGGGGGERIIIQDVPVSTGGKAEPAWADDHRVFIGRRSDPFFFDVKGVLNNFQITGSDFFADKDICSIVLEVPNTALGQRAIDVWVRILVPASPGGGWVQVERGARPSQTPFLTGEQNEAYRAAEPAGDGRFVPVFAHSLEHTGGYTPDNARRTAETLLPDVMHFQPGRPTSFPDNGRSLTDDVTDAFLAILTNGKVTSDQVGPHGDLLPEFPYLGPPHGKSP